MKYIRFLLVIPAFGLLLFFLKPAFASEINYPSPEMLSATTDWVNLYSRKDLSLIKRIVNGDVIALGQVTLADSIIFGRTQAGTHAGLINSHLYGILSVSSHYTSLDKSSINGLIVSSSQNRQMGRVLLVKPKGELESAPIYLSSTISPQATGTLSPNSAAELNGYSIQKYHSQTGLTTPDGQVYQNGLKVFGEGPERYEAYRVSAPEAPHIVTPEWDEAALPDAESRQVLERNAIPEDLVLVENGSVVNGDIVFESGRGRVRVSADSVFNGTVTGGIVQYVPAPVVKTMVPAPGEPKAPLDEKSKESNRLRIDPVTDINPALPVENNVGP